jgi:hypothetical protein
MPIELGHPRGQSTPEKRGPSQKIADMSAIRWMITDCLSSPTDPQTSDGNVEAYREGRREIHSPVFDVITFRGVAGRACHPSPGHFYSTRGFFVFHFPKRGGTRTSVRMSHAVSPVLSESIRLPGRPHVVQRKQMRGMMLLIFSVIWPSPPLPPTPFRTCSERGERR